MAKYATKAEYWQAKYEGQLRRCEDLKATIDSMQVDIDNHKRVINANNSRIGSYIHTVKVMKAKILRLEED